MAVATQNAIAQKRLVIDLKQVSLLMPQISESRIHSLVVIVDEM